MLFAEDKGQTCLRARFKSLLLPDLGQGHLIECELPEELIRDMR